MSKQNQKQAYLAGLQTGQQGTAGQPSGGQQVVTPAPATPPANQPSTGGQPSSGGQPPSQRTVVSSTTSTTTKAKWPWWKKWGIALLVLAFATLIVALVGMNKAREAEREAFLAALDEAKAVQELPTEVEPEGEEILDPDVSFVREGVESVPESAQETVMSDGSVILDPSVTEEAQYHGTSPQVWIVSVKKSSGGVTITYDIVVAPPDTFVVVGETRNHWIPGQEETVERSGESSDTGTVFVPVSNWEDATHVRVLLIWGPTRNQAASDEFLIS